MDYSIRKSIIHNCLNNNMSLAPIVLFVYNRLWHTQQTVEALQKCKLAAESDLYIFADGPKEDASEEVCNRIVKVRRYLHSIDGFKSVRITENFKNKGLANSVIQGVSEVINKHGKVIVVEDDIVVHPFFLRFMNDALEFYEKDSRIFMLSGFNSRFVIPWWYNKDVFIVHRSCSWGWGMWKDRWNLADWSISDFDEFKSNYKQIELFNRGGSDMAPMLFAQKAGKIDSWAIRWDYCMFKHNGYCLHPRCSLVENLGFDEFGSHCTSPSHLNDPALFPKEKHNIRLVKNIKFYKEVETNFKKYNDNTHDVPFVKKMKRLVKKHLSLYHQ